MRSMSFQAEKQARKLSLKCSNDSAWVSNMLKDLIEQHSAAETVIDECFCQAETALKKITCYNIRLNRNAPDVRYICVDGFFCEEITDRPENRRRFFGSDPNSLTAYLIDSAIQKFAFENQHILNCSYDKIVECCYSFLGDR